MSLLIILSENTNLLIVTNAALKNTFEDTISNVKKDHNDVKQTISQIKTNEGITITITIIIFIIIIIIIIIIIKSIWLF